MRNIKIGVVFNASAVITFGMFLNHILHTGKQLQNEITNIIFLFRQHRIVFCTDDQCLQLVYWREKPSDPLQIFQLPQLLMVRGQHPTLPTV